MYAEGLNGNAKKQSTLDLIQGLPQDLIVLPVQTLGELFNVLVKKARLEPAEARLVLLNWQDSYPLVETSARA